MDIREWLTLVAQANGAAPSSAKHYHGYATSIRRDFPSMVRSLETAEAVAGHLGGQFPAWDDLRSAIRGTMTAAEFDASETTEEQRRTQAWIAFYRRRVREAPHRRDHLLSLLRTNDLDAFKAVDDGHVERANEEFDRQFWEARGGHPGYVPVPVGQPIPALRYIAHAPGRRSASAPVEPPPRPKPAHLTGEALEAARARILRERHGVGA
jgi:hypothetical protein